MKHYILWTKGGSSIEGDLEDAEAAQLKADYLAHHGETLPRVYGDKTGELIIAFDKVEAMAINEPEEFEQRFKQPPGY